MCSSSSTASPRDVEVRYTKFTINGILGEKHAVFVPDHLRLTMPVFSEICSAIGKDVPSMFVSGLGCLRHPASLSTRQLRECPGFRQLMEDAKSSLGLGGGEDLFCSLEACTPGRGGRSNWQRDGELRPGDADPSGRSLADTANHVLETKIASTITGIATAAHRTNAWIYSGPQISNFEIFLQQCIDRTEVFRLVVGHLQDKAYMETRASKILLQQLFGASQTMSTQAVYRAPVIRLQGDLWNPKQNKTHEEFKRYGYDYWSFNTYGDRESESHPITQWPWPYGDLYVLFYKEETPSADPQPRVDWDFTTKQKHDWEAIPFKPDVPTAHVCIGGNEANAKKKLLQVMKNLGPVIVLDNTPSVPKQMSVLLNALHRVWSPSALRSCRPYLDGSQIQLWGNPSSSELLQALSPHKLLQHVESQFNCSGMEENERLCLSDVVGLLELAKRRPQDFRDAACVLDPLRNSVDEVVSQAMVLLSSSAAYREPCTGMELRSLVREAWRLHRKLAQEANILRTRATCLVMTIAGTLLLTAVLASVAVGLCLQKTHFQEINYHVTVYLLHEKLEVAYTWSEATRLLRGCLVILPFVAGALVLVGAHFQFNLRWMKVHMVASILVSEIYQFLGFLRPYAGQPESSQRALFEARLKELMKKLPPSDQQEPELGLAEEDFARDPRALEEHVDQHLYGVQPPSWIRKKVDLCPVSVRSLGGSWASEPRDLTAQVSAESYVELRILPLRKFFRGRAQSLSCQRTALSIFFVLCLILAAGLAACGLHLWVPLPLGVASFLAVVTHWFAPSEMLMAMNSALAVLNSLDLRWHGSDIRENRSDASKHHLIANTERICRVVAMIHTRSTSVPDYGEDEDIRGVTPASQDQSW